MRLRFLLAALVVVLPSLPSTVHAANILLVLDSTSDGEIAAALMMDGHTVTTVTNDFATGNPTLRADLSGYDAVYWSANGPGYGAEHLDASVFSNLTTYVMDGGHVFVTGYDSVASPTDPMLISFLGGTGSTDVPPEPGPIIMADNSLTVGVVDIRGVTPTGGYSDRDTLLGLTAGTIEVSGTPFGSGSQWTLRTLGGGEIVYVANGAPGGSSTSSWTTVAAGGIGAYNAALRNFAFAADAAAVEPGAPLIEFTSPFEAAEGDAITVEVAITDEEGDPYTFSWDTDDDMTFGELPGMTTFTVAAGTTDGDSSVRLVVQASDGTHVSQRRRTIRITNVEPRITSTPPGLVSVGEDLRYEMVAEDPAGPLDPLTWAIVRGPDGATISDSGVFSWIPTELDVTLGSETIMIEVEVDDGDGGLGTQAWEMSVSPNHPPDGMQLLYPTAGIGLLETQPRLVVSDGINPDTEDMLTYFFELDSDVDFADPILFDSGPIAQTPGYTAFPLPSPLAPGLYHWRAWMSDGFVETEPLTASFFVLQDPDADAGPLPDGGPTGSDSGMTVGPMGPRGCGCSTPGSSRGTPIALALALGALIALRRRR